MSATVDFPPKRQTRSLKEALLSQAESTLREWFPNGTIRGHRFMVGGITGKAGKSLKVNMRTGVWKDFAKADVAGPDLLSLYQAVHGIDWMKAYDELAPNYLIGTIARPPAAREQPDEKAVPIVPVPLEHRHDYPKRGVAQYLYRNADGALTHVVCRHQDADGKWFEPWFYGRKGEKQAYMVGATPKPWPLYNAHHWHPTSGRAASRIFIVEGEKCADALARIAMKNRVVTWQSGAVNWKNADWTFLSGTTEAVIWPDNDPPGLEAAQGIAETLHDLGVPAKILDLGPHLERLPIEARDGADCADFIQAMSEDDFKLLLVAAIAAAPTWAAAQLSVIASGRPDEPVVATSDDAAMTVNGQPVLGLVAGGLHLAVDECIHELRRTGVVYSRASRLVRIVERRPEQTVTSSSRKPGERVIAVTRQWVRCEIGRRRRIQKFDQRRQKCVPKDCPESLANTIVELGSWPAIAPLATVASAPLLRPDGTICAVQGYDPATSVYLELADEFPSIPEAPTADDAAAALAKILEPFREFGLGHPKDLNTSALMALVLTAVARATLPTAPLFLMTSSTPGTGKGLLADVVALIADGSHPRVVAPSADPEEMRKLLTSVAIAGDSILVIDNLPNGQRLVSTALCSFVTAAVISDRELGASRRVTLDNRLLVVVTGNNISAGEDLARRTITIQLDARCERPQERQFRVIDLRAHVLEIRPMLVASALTILRAWHLARPSNPEHVQVLGSFESWSQVVRGALLWLGLPDPVRTQAGADDGLDELAIAFEALHTQFPDGFHARDAESATFGLHAHEGLRHALTDAGCREARDGRLKVGYWLRERRKRIAGGLLLVPGDKHPSRGVRWRVEPLLPSEQQE